MGGRREHQAARLADGRLLGFAEYGATDGRAVLVLHREVGSRLLGSSFDAGAARLGLRIISPDRPGMGFSDFQRGRTIGDWPADVVELTAQLGIDRFAVLGVAAGAAYALACAWKLPDRLTATLLASPVVALSMSDRPPGEPLLARIVSESAVKAPWTIRVAMTGLELMARRSPEQAVDRMAASAGDADRDAFARPEVRTMLAASLAETFRSGARGAARDLRLATADWGVPFADVVAPVTIWHGDADTEVPDDTVRRLAAALPHGEVRPVPGAGHHLTLSHPDLLLDALAGGS
jgi:pimeloyl-ACP methyl ester carboxylesterase